MTNNHEYQLEAAFLAKEINLAKAAEKLDKNLIGRRREFLTPLMEVHGQKKQLEVLLV